eukprot:g82939.t1
MQQRPRGQHRRDREELLAGARPLHSDTEATQASYNARTSALLSLLQQAENRSNLAEQDVQNANEKLGLVHSEYRRFGAALDNAKGLITKLARSKDFDRILIGFFFCIYCCVIVFIVQRRLGHFFGLY